MKLSVRIALFTCLGLLSGSPQKTGRAQTLVISHPDAPDQGVEYFLENQQRAMI